MKILLIAYEFPPSPSPQSLRWFYLTRELIQQGMDVHVLCPDVRPSGSSMIGVPPGVIVHRTYPGYVTGIVNWIACWHRRRHPGAVVLARAPAAGESRSTLPPTLNWKGRSLEKLQAIAGRLIFPDSRGEWRFFARRKLEQLLDELNPAVVVSSHEPATTLEVGHRAKRSGLPWVVDLGDPVLSFYTPAKWRRRAFALERLVCGGADRIIVTTERARALLVERHDGDPNRFAVLTQGFDAKPRAEAGPQRPQSDVDWSEDHLELLYTGSFYDFREPRALVDAVISMAGVRLTVATSRAPAWLVERSESSLGKIRLLGFLPHSDVVELQKQAHVLVNLANADATHVPGKLYEYLGAGRPILHIGSGPEDAGADLVRRGAGVVCDNDEARIMEALAQLQKLREQRPGWGGMPSSLVDKYSWQSIGMELGSILRAVAA